MSEQKIEQFWRDATADDVARVMRGEAVEIRVRDADREDWRYGEYLGGFHCGSEEFEWKDRDGVPWQHCQVYDPPEILKHKPDPGEGYRLLEKFPPEDLQEGDECYNPDDNQWSESANARPPSLKQSETLWYRRRIANNPEIPDSSTAANSSETPNSCRSRDIIPSGWRLLGKDEERLASDAYWSQGCQDWIIIGDDRVAAANMFPREYAIRRLGSFDLVAGFNYILPNGKVVRVTEKGFEVQ